MIYLATLILLFIAGATYAVNVGAIITVTTIKGLMFGSLVVSDDYEDEGITAHTFQMCLFFITFTAQWETEM